MMRIESLRTTASLIASVLFSLSLFLLSDAIAQDKGKPAASDAIMQLYRAAKKEGTVVIRGPSDPIIYQRAQERLNKEYPGIKIDHFESLPEPVVQNLITERQAGKPSSVDIVQSGSLRAVRPLIDRDMLVAFPGWEKDFGLDAVYAGNRFVGNYNLSLPIAYNTNLVSAQEAPKTWEDLADAKWKGRKIIVEARLVPFAMLGSEIGKAKAIELAKKVLAQDPIILQGGTTVLNALAGGQAPIAIGLYGYAVEKLKKKGAPIDWVPVSPLPLLTSAMGVVKTAPHPSAARFLAGWMGSIEGGKIIYEYSGQATLVGKNAYGPEAERLKRSHPKIILETDKNFAAIQEVQREIGKLAGALR